MKQFSILTAKQYHRYGVGKVPENLIEICRNTGFSLGLDWI